MSELNGPASYIPSSGMLPEELKIVTEPKYGVISCKLNPDDHSCDNAILFTVTALLMLKKWNDDTRKYAYYAGMKWTNDYGHYWDDLEDLLEACKEFVGGGYLFNRYPGDRSLNRQDDAIAVAAYDYAIGTSGFHAIRLYEFGRDNFWVFDNTESAPETYAWLDGLNTIKWLPRYLKQWIALVMYFDKCIWRFPGMAAFFKHCAHLDLDKVEQFSIGLALIGVYLDGKKDSSGKCLQYLKCSVLVGKYKFIDRCIGIWKRRVESQHDGFMEKVYAVYFPAGHPFIKYAYLMTLVV